MTAMPCGDLHQSFTDAFVTVAHVSLKRQRKTILFYSSYFIFFRPQIFDVLWTDFCEPLPHNAVCSEFDYVLYGCSYVPHKNMSDEKPQFSPICGPKIVTSAPHFLMRGKPGNLKQYCQSEARTRRPYQTSKIGFPLRHGKF